jgi:hypothetical protein
MTRTQKIVTTLLMVAVGVIGFGMFARGEARDRARWYCERALTQRHEKDGYLFTYHEPSRWEYESRLYQLTWTDLGATYGELHFKTDAICIFDSRAREVRAVSLAGNDLPNGELPHLRKALKDIGYYNKAP